LFAVIDGASCGARKTRFADCGIALERNDIYRAEVGMSNEQMTLIERLRNPQWVGSHSNIQLHIDVTVANMDAAAARIERLETAITRYLADDFGCNGGAMAMFEEALAVTPS
jgi:hypothetical protein